MRWIVLIVGLLVCTLAVHAQWEQRPYLKYEGDVEKLQEAVADSMRPGAEELAGQLVVGDRSAEANEKYMADIDSLIALYAETGEQQYADRALLILRTVSEPYLQQSPEEIGAAITPNGVLDDVNVEMRGVAYDLARIYHLSLDPEVAGKVAGIMEGFATHIPDWPLKKRGSEETTTQDGEQFLRYWGATGIWGSWYHTDMLAHTPLVRAFDLIYDSGVMQKRGTLETIERDCVRHPAELYLKRPMDLFNMTGSALHGLINTGKAVPYPEYIHIAVLRHRYHINGKYYADGFWHEGTPAYHRQISSRIAGSIARELEGYSDPPGFTCDIDLPRYDNLDLEAEYERQYERIWNALKKLTFPGPGKDYAKIHEATWPHPAWYDERVEESKPRLLGCMGHAIVGTGTYPEEAELHLNFSGTHNHEHYDNLNIILWSHGREVLSEGRYRAPADSVTTREWHTATAAHNTVVVDEGNQSTRFSGHRRKITAKDAMEDIAQHPGMVIDIPNWTHRSNGMGDAHNDGKLRCYATDNPDVQVMEAEAELSWNPSPEIYRRTVALVRVGESGYYAFDVFRVRGGETHDWMLHGCLNIPYELRTSVDLVPREGTLHKYLEDLRAGGTDEPWTATFEYEEGPHLRTHVLGAENTEVIVGQAPAIRKEGYSDFLDVRREGPESCFMAVHDVISDGSPNIESVEAIEWGGSLDCGVTVQLADGRTDIILSSGDDAAPFTRQLVPPGIEFQGRFAFFRTSGDTVENSYAVDTSHLKYGEMTLDGPGFFEGEITATRRIEAGDDTDAFITDAEVPEGQEGRCIIVDLGGELVQSHIIDHIEPTADGTVIHVTDDPGIEIRGDLIRMMYYPGWGIERPAIFHIAGTVAWARQ
ncbi:MAG: heparinase II/III family protein [Armatimonadota bacterium]